LDLAGGCHGRVPEATGGGKKEVATGSRVSSELRRDPETLLPAAGQRSPGRWEVGEAEGTHRSQGQCCRRMRGSGGGEG